MKKLASLWATGLSILASSMVSLPAHASLQGTLQRGGNQYIEVSLESGQYIVYVHAVDTITKGVAEASFSMYETNGKLIKESGALSPALQIGSKFKKGAVFEIRQPQKVRFLVRMTTCNAPLCGYVLVPVKAGSGRMEVVTPPSQVLSDRPSSTAANPVPPSSDRANSGTSQTCPGSDTSSNQSGTGNRYVFYTNSHTDTGLTVKPGDEIKVKANGRVRFGFFAGSGDPRGIVFNPDYNYFINLLHGQLMVRVRRFGMSDLAGWTGIGTGASFIVRQQGALEFAVNDNKPEDNVGRFCIEVTVYPGKS